MHDISFLSGLDMLFCFEFGLGVVFGIISLFNFQKEEKYSDKISDIISAILLFAFAMWSVAAIIRGVA